MGLSMWYKNMGHLGSLKFGKHLKGNEIVIQMSLDKARTFSMTYW